MALLCVNNADSSKQERLHNTLFIFITYALLLKEAVKELSTLVLM